MEKFLRYFKDADSFNDAAAREIASLIVEAVEARGRATLALAGGNTPKPVYERLAALPGLPWEQVDVFMGDERMVPPDSGDSNLLMAQKHLLGALEEGRPRVHPIETVGMSTAEAAAAYNGELSSILDGDKSAEGPGRLDLVLLGMGGDGHTASLFPHAAARRENAARVAAVSADEMSEGMTPRVDRVTLTPRALNESRCALFMLTGDSKLQLFEAMESGDSDAAALPAAQVRPQDCLIWYLLKP